MINQIKTNPQLNCLVFKTNIEDKDQESRLIYVLEKIDGIIDWNLDLENWEHVLRIEYSSIQIEKLTQELSDFGIEIERLPIW